MTETGTHIAYLVFARMGSARFPGKVLRTLQGETLLDGIVARLRMAGAERDAICIATTDRDEDDALADHCAAAGHAVFRGDAADVCGRALAAADSLQAQAFFRVNADSPFVNERLVSEAAALYDADSLQLVTNIPGRTWPYGVSCELVDVETLRGFHARGLTAQQKEHLASVLYENLDALRHHVLYRGDDGRPLCVDRLTVDEPGDLEALERACDARGVRWPREPFRSIIDKLGMHNDHAV